MRIVTLVNHLCHFIFKNTCFNCISGNDTTLRPLFGRHTIWWLWAHDDWGTMVVVYFPLKTSCCLLSFQHLRLTFFTRQTRRYRKKATLGCQGPKTMIMHIFDSVGMLLSLQALLHSKSEPHQNIKKYPSLQYVGCRIVYLEEQEVVS